MQAGKTTPTHGGCPRRVGRRVLIAICMLGFWLGCGDDTATPGDSRAASTPSTSVSPPPETEAKPAAAADPKELAEKGRTYYLSSCIACHNSDPAKEGALGPPVADSSWELIEARVMRAEYPPGYTPKRDTRVMVAMPFLKRQLPALAAYLAPPE